MKRMSLLMMLFIASLTFGMVGCEEESGLEGVGNDISDASEEAGDNMEDAADDTEDAVEDATN